MAFSLLMCSAVIVLCILANRFLKRFGIPAVLIFIGLGMLFGSEGIVKIPFDNFQIAETICCTALIFIMFYGGFGTSYREAKPILPKAVLLSTMGILITAGLTGLFCYYVVGMSLQEGLLTGAVLSSTDAASVFSILRSKKLNLKEGTASLLEVESGSNDPFAYMLTIIILNWMAGDGENIVLLIVEEVGLGLLFGAGLGLLAVKILKTAELEAGGIDTILMIAFVLFSYAAPVLIGGNGYLSVYLFGFIVGNARFKSRVSLVHFFESIDHLAQMLIFFLLGLLVFPSMLLPILGTSVLIFLGLTFIARPVAVLLVMTPFHSSWRQQALTAFAGLRGAASAVFAIIAVVSPGYAGYDVYNIVFCVAIISVAFQGLLLPLAAEKLDMVDDSQNVMKTFSDYQDDQEMQLIQIRLIPGHKYIGKKLKELNLGDVLVVLIERGDETIIPRGDVLLQQGDVLVLSGETYHGDADTVLDELTIEPGDSRIGRRVRDIRGLENSLIVLIRRKDGNTVVPRGDTFNLPQDFNPQSGGLICSRGSSARTMRSCSLCSFAGFFSSDILLQIFHYIGQRDRLQFPLHRFLYPLQFIVQDIVYIPSYRTVRIRILMEMEQGIILNAFHRAVYIQKRDLIQRFDDRRAPGPPLHLDQSRIPELGEDPADDNRVYIDTGCQKITGNLILFLKRLHTGHHMYSDCKSA